MSFSYTGSALNSLVDGLTNNAAPVVTCLNDVKTWLNTDTETAFSSYKSVLTANAIASSLTNGNIVVFTARGGFSVTSTSFSDSTPLTPVLFYLDPADYTANTRANKYRLKATLATNATAPLSTFTFGLYPVSAAAGGAGVNTLTFGAVTSGSTAAFAAPGASGLSQANSGDFTAPAAGYYAPALSVTTSMAANSSIIASVILQYRQV